MFDEIKQQIFDGYKCCGNCACYEHYPNSTCIIVPAGKLICSNWAFDNMTAKERIEKTDKETFER